MNVLSRIVARVAKREGNIIISGLTPAVVRPISSSSGIDKYIAPYPSLPKVESKDSGPPTPAASLSSHEHPPTGRLSDLFGGLMNRNQFIPELAASDRWVSVHEGVLREVRVPGNVYTGRSVPVTDNLDVPSAYRRLHAILNRNRVRSELFLQRRYEKPSDKERRLKSERHRRRFAAWVRSIFLNKRMASDKVQPDTQKGSTGIRNPQTWLNGKAKDLQSTIYGISKGRVPWLSVDEAVPKFCPSFSCVGR